MNEVFAIDPHSPQDIKDVASLVKGFGLQRGRFIANYPTDWLETLRQYLSKLEGIDSLRLSRLLELNKDALLDVDCDFRRAKSWIENAHIHKNSKAFSKVLGPDPNSFNIESLQHFLTEGDFEDKSRGGHIPMTPEAYRKATGPLFRKSTEVHLVDPFFWLRRENGALDRGRISVLRELFLEAECSKRCEVFFVHFQRPDVGQSDIRRRQIEQDVKEIESDLENICTDAILNRVQIQYSISDKNRHGRYIFSIKGGLQFDHGFDVIRNKTNHVHWLSKSELEPIFKEYG